MTKQCSWCKRWLIGDKWIHMMKKYQPKGEDITHGMCPDCKEQAEKKLDELKRIKEGK